MLGVRRWLRRVSNVSYGQVPSVPLGPFSQGTAHRLPCVWPRKAGAFYTQGQTLGETLRPALAHAVVCLSILPDRKPGASELLGLRGVRQTASEVSPQTCPISGWGVGSHGPTILLPVWFQRICVLLDSHCFAMNRAAGLSHVVLMPPGMARATERRVLDTH